MPDQLTDKSQSAETKPKAKRRFINYSWIVHNIPFLLYLAVLAIVYIYNGHYADELTRSISKTEKSVKDLEYQYKTVKSEVIYRSKASELMRVVEPIGLKEIKEPPIRLNDSTSKVPNK